MALEAFDKIPIWQRLVVLVLGAALIVAGWWYLFYADALDAHDGAKVALEKAQAELARVEKAKADFLERQKKQEEVEKAIEQKLQVLPMSASTVDNLMQTFQQQARLVGMTVESWTPEAEVKEDFYAKLPVKVRATGTWKQSGEFFRRVSELNRIVSVDKLSMRLSGRNQADAGGHPILELDFEAATYRFLTDAERNAAANKQVQSRRKGAGQ